MTRFRSDERFPLGAQSFLRALAKNNNKGWFDDHRQKYTELLKDPGERVCDALSSALSNVVGNPVRYKTYRINRDLRFAKDKTPYNVHLRASFGGEADLTKRGCWHFSLDADRMTFGTGIIGFSKQDLKQYRRVLSDAAGLQLLDLISVLESNGYRIPDPELKRPPAPALADERLRALSCRKSLAVWQDCVAPFPKDEAAFVQAAMAGYQALMPLILWLDEFVFSKSDAPEDPSCATG